jgi:hypothetical protein
MEFVEEELDNNNKQRIENLEEKVFILMENNNKLISLLNDTQKYLVKLTHNQNEMTKRIKDWPYIVVKDNI